MSELLKVHLLSSDIRTCFFYLNDVDLRNKKSDKCGIKICFGTDHEMTTFGSVMMTAHPEVPPKCIGVASLYANKLCLEENEVVLMSYCDVDSINTVQIIPKKEEDYIILLRCKTILETYLLSQVCVVAEGQTLPLYVFSNISIDVEIGNIDTKDGYGQLGKFTEIIVLHPSEKQYFVKTDCNKNGRKKSVRKGNQLEIMINKLNTILQQSIPEVNSQEEEAALKNILNTSNNTRRDYTVQPSFLLKSDIDKKILDKFIIVSNFADSTKTFGPHSIKILAKVEQLNVNSNSGEEGDNFYVNSYVISLNDTQNMTAFCPPHIMKKLKLYVGSKITVTKAKPDVVVECSKMKNVVSKEFFWQSMEQIRESITQTIVNNFKYNYKLNILVVGGLGTGKTSLLTDVARTFSEDFFYCKFIQCKTLRGKKIETLHKMFYDNLKECCCYDPSILILDDLHSLTFVEDDEGGFNKLYSNRIVDLISECLKDFQGKYNMTVIASSNDISQLSNLVSTHGPRLFHIVHKVPEINSAERKTILKYILDHDARILESSAEFDKITTNTNGYTIQDLVDLIDKAIFNSLLRSEPAMDLLSINAEDFDLALSESTPLNLRGIKLKEKIGKKWGVVGGMTEPKKILTEVFSWPTKYPELLESCPLRLQRGVLLYGAPGTGKTLLAGALADQCGLNFISVKGPEVLSKYVGASEEGVRNLFLQAERTRPCLLFFDEFDSLAPKRGHDSTGVTDRVVNQLLTQLDGVEALNGVWVLAATSRPDLIDPALLRPGRLDKMVFCGVPNQEDRLSILEALSQDLPKAENFNLLEISQKSEGYTGADLQAIMCNAQMLAIKERKNQLESGVELKIYKNHLLAALGETKPSLSSLDILKYENIYKRFLNSRKRNFVENYGGTQKVTLA